MNNPPHHHHVHHDCEQSGRNNNWRPWCSTKRLNTIAVLHLMWLEQWLENTVVHLISVWLAHAMLRRENPLISSNSTSSSLSQKTLQIIFTERDEACFNFHHHLNVSKYFQHLICLIFSLTIFVLCEKILQTWNA